MTVQAGWVGTSAKEETGKAWMSEARLELSLSKAGWMSEMVGASTETEVVFVNTENRTQANIHTLMGSPTEASAYTFENTATISAASRGGWALQTGAFPAGSTLTIINRGHIRGGGGNGGRYLRSGGAGGTALILNVPASIDNTTGTIWGGGGGGGGALVHGGGGGGGTLAGAGGAGSGSRLNGSGGSATSGGAGSGSGTGSAGRGGNVGAAGGRGGSGSSTWNGGRGGYSVQANGNAVTWIAVGDRRGSVV